MAEIEADSLSFDEVFSELGRNEVTNDKHVKFMLSVWLKQLTQPLKKNQQLHHFRQSLKRLNNDLESEKMLKATELDLDKRLQVVGSFSQILTSALPSLNSLSIGHFAGLCACHGLSAALAGPGGSQFFAFGDGGHIHIGKDGEKIFHDDHHKPLKKHSFAPSASFRPSHSSQISTSSRDEPVYLFPEIKLLPTFASVGLEAFFRFGPTNSISPGQAFAS